MKRTILSASLVLGIFCACAPALASVQSYKLTDLGNVDLPWSPNQKANGSLNDLGQQVGMTPNGHAAIIQHDQPWKFVDLGTLGGPFSASIGINDLSQVVGWSFVGNGKTHAFIWDGGPMLDLNTLVVGDWSGYSYLSIGEKIKDSGLIYGYGYLISGVQHTFLLTPTTVPSPVPEPAAVTMLLIGVGLMGLVGNKKIHPPS